MKLVLPKNDFLKAITMAQSAVSNKSTLPVLSNLLIEAENGSVTVTGTDLEIGLKVKMAVEVVQGGSVTAPAKRLADIIRESPDGEIEFEVKDGNRIAIKTAKGKFAMSGISAEDFPNLPAQKKEKSVQIEDRTLQRMIKKTVFSVSTEETRYVLNGALFNVEGKKVRMVSTDGHRLSIIEKELSKSADNVSAVVPTKALNEMLKVLDGSDEAITVYFTENHLFVEKNNVMLVSRLIDGQFPNYDQVIPKKNENLFKASTEELGQAVRRCAVMASDRANSVRFMLKAGNLSIQANTPDVGEAEVETEVQYTGPEMTISFNARYVQDALKAIESKEVEFRLSGPLSPALVLPVEENADSRFVVMPMRT